MLHQDDMVELIEVFEKADVDDGKIKHLSKFFSSILMEKGKNGIQRDIGHFYVHVQRNYIDI